MKCVMISIRPEWCEKILKGQKTIEVRKNAPKLVTPFRCYIYCTDGRTLRIGNDGQLLLSSKNRHKNIHRCPVLNKTVLGEFTCNCILPIEVQDNGSIRDWNQYHLASSCVPYEDVADYIGNGNTGYGWHIDNLKIYSNPIRITDFAHDGICQYNEKDNRCSYNQHCYRAGKKDDGHGHGRCGEWMDRAPQSWCYVEERKSLQR